MTRLQPYRPPLPQPPAALIRVDTCDTRSHTFCGTHTATAQHLRGRRWLHTSATAHWTLFTAHTWTYTFSAKEKDVETGLSYFGSRYYSSDLSIWLSVDPMSDKYAYQSGYVYCGNNPIKIIDPNGEDEWDLGKDGTLSQRANGRTDVDIVHAKDKNGNDVERYYHAGSINFNAQCNEKYDEEVGWCTVLPILC